MKKSSVKKLASIMSKSGLPPKTKKLKISSKY
jgi:hypothetical protein